MAHPSRSSRDRQHVQLGGSTLVQPMKAGSSLPGRAGERALKAFAVVVLSKQLRRLARIPEGASTWAAQV